MRLNYYPDTDSLYIHLSEQPSVESQEISEGILLDYDAEGGLVDTYATDTYRVVYTVKIGRSMYVLHCFQKKSKHGISTPKNDIHLIKRRLRQAKEMEKEL